MPVEIFIIIWILNWFSQSMIQKVGKMAHKIPQMNRTTIHFNFLHLFMFYAMLFRYKGRLVTSQQNVIYILSCLNLKCRLIEMCTKFAPDYGNKISLLQKASNSQGIHPKTCPSHREPPIWEVEKWKSFDRIGLNFKAKWHKTTKNSYVKTYIHKSAMKISIVLSQHSLPFSSIKK